MNAVLLSCEDRTNMGVVLYSSGRLEEALELR